MLAIALHPSERSGSFSVVKLVVEKSTGEKFADKIISKVKGPGATEKGCGSRFSVLTKIFDCFSAPVVWR